ncbi:hypothetical protein CASFOL_017941 [Castilleja foliolosa]|uniref:Carbohydrate kinase PfkB domain-containing protein n=1 Tax=Castilleja foliolosa TaxID=1961234 RepID=A0ABD3D8D8_9LAMI
MGTISDNGAEAVVIGGMVLDINATPSVAANPRTTTPGKVVYTLGGVARNVAECMSKLGQKPYMISAIGLDFPGNILLEHWKSAGLSVDGINRSQDIETAVVCNIFDGKGELAAVVASVEAIEKFLTSEWIQKFKFNICSAPILMVDANLSPAALLASCRMAVECETSVWFEPVSVAKSKKIVSIVKHLVAMANALLKPPTWALLENGIKVIIVTLGPDGVLLCFKAKNRVRKYDFKKNGPFSFSRKLYEAINLSCPPNIILGGSELKGSYNNIAVHFPALSASVVRLTGAGDCLVGGTIAALCAGLDLMQSVAVGIAAAKGAVESERNVPGEYELSRIADDARRVYSQARVVFCESKIKLDLMSLAAVMGSKLTGKKITIDRLTVAYEDLSGLTQFPESLYLLESIENNAV